jgi:hypothetical protein
MANEQMECEGEGLGRRRENGRPHVETEDVYGIDIRTMDLYVANQHVGGLKTGEAKERGGREGPEKECVCTVRILYSIPNTGEEESVSAGRHCVD